MSRTRAATPAGRSRKTASRATAKPTRRAAPAPRGAATRSAGAKPAKAKRSSTKPATTKRSSAKPKTTARRSAAKPKTARRPSTKPATARRSATKPRTARRSAAKPAKARRSASRFIRSAFGGVSWRYRLGIAAVVAVCAAAGYFLWLRDSSLVAIDNVDVVGVASGDRGQIVGELTDASEAMTTLHVDRGKLESIAAGFPTVASIDIDPNFPHGMRIEVTERPPTMIVSSGGRQVPVAADGTLLTGVAVPDESDLPVLEVDQIPSGATLGGEPLEQALVVGAAPEPLRPLIEKIGHSQEYGVEVTMRGGIPIRFGIGSAAAEKWEAVAAVLADPQLDSLSYVDVRVPERPAAGGVAGPVAPTDPPA